MLLHITLIKMKVIDMMNYSDYMIHIHNEKTLPSLEDTPKEVIIADAAIEQAIQDVFCYCKEHSIQTELFDLLLVRHYYKMRNDGSIKFLSEKYLRNLFDTFLIDDHLELLDNIKAIRLLYDNGIEVQLYSKQMKMFYRRFCRICYNRFKEERRKHLIQLLRHKLHIEEIVEEDISGATIGYFYNVNKVPNWYMLISTTLRQLYLMFHANFPRLGSTISEKRKYKAIYEEIKQMIESLFHFLYKQQCNPDFLYNVLYHTFDRNINKFDLYMITKDHRIIYLNYDKIVIYNHDMNRVHTVPSSISIGTTFSYPPIVFFECNIIDQYHPPVIFDKSDDIEKIPEDAYANFFANSIKISNWCIHQKHLDECRTIIYDGDLIKLFSEIAYYYDCNIGYQVIVPDAKSLLS